MFLAFKDLVKGLYGYIWAVYHIFNAKEACGDHLGSEKPNIRPKQKIAQHDQKSPEIRCWVCEFRVIKGPVQASKCMVLGL